MFGKSVFVLEVCGGRSVFGGRSVVVVGVVVVGVVVGGGAVGLVGDSIPWLSVGAKCVGVGAG